MTGQGDWSRGHEDVARAVPILEIGERDGNHDVGAVREHS